MRRVKLNGEWLDIPEPGDPGYFDRQAADGTTPLRGDLRVKVSEKRAVSVYGLRRFPITLYAEEWEAILRHADAITSFINSHPELSRKGVSQ